MSADEFHYELKKLSPAGTEAALAKAQRYRLLNEPGEAESICRDVLAVDPNHHQAQIDLLLAITDQFHRGLQGRYEEAKELLEGLDDYEAAYYHGMICERRAKAMYRHASPGCGSAAYGWFRRAMEWFEKAEKLAPSGNEVAILRWNACARKIMNNPDLRPDVEERHGIQSE